MDETEARIRQDMEETRAAMSAKIDMIQNRMEDTVEEAGATVARVVTGVMEQVKRVQDLVEHITSTADATVTQVQETAQRTAVTGTPGTKLITDLYQRPWVMMGTAVLLGYILGSGGRSNAGQRRTPAQMPSHTPPPDKPAGNPFVASSSPPADSNPSTRLSARMTGPAGTPSS